VTGGAFGPPFGCEGVGGTLPTLCVDVTAQDCQAFFLVLRVPWKVGTPSVATTAGGVRLLAGDTGGVAGLLRSVGAGLTGQPPGLAIGPGTGLPPPSGPGHDLGGDGERLRGCGPVG
jgi:hypothetical protein